MADHYQCPVCTTQAAISSIAARDAHDVDCPQCGKFSMSGTAWAQSDLLRQNAGAISGWINEQNRMGAKPEIYSGEIMDRLRQLSVPEFTKRAEKYLEAAYDLAGTLHGRFEVGHARLIGASFCSSAEDCHVILTHLVNKGLVIKLSVGYAQITPEGHIQLDALRRDRSSLSQGFVAMWFSPEMADAYEKGFEPAIARAGYRPLRIDQKEHANKIDDEIIREIRRSRLLVADLTGHRAGVYYEAGFAYRLALPVFYTCRSDEFDKVHFDIRQFNCISWASPDTLAIMLRNRIEAVLGAGPNALPPT
jgi:nucleoside 2-deoxyribosyltransferase